MHRIEQVTLCFGIDVAYIRRGTAYNGIWRKYVCVSKSDARRLARACNRMPGRFWVSCDGWAWDREESDAQD